jgi:hypothetical protein
VIASFRGERRPTIVYSYAIGTIVRPD